MDSLLSSDSDDLCFSNRLRCGESDRPFSYSPYDTENSNLKELCSVFEDDEDYDDHAAGLRYRSEYEQERVACIPSTSVDVSLPISSTKCLTYSRIARLSGLSTPFNDNNPFDLIYTSLETEDLVALFLEPVDCERDVQLPVNLGKLERWDVLSDSVKLLAELAPQEEPSLLNIYPNEVTLLRKLMVVEPALAMDPQQDLAQLRSRNAVQIASTGTIPFALDVEADEGLTWPTATSRIREAITEQLNGERLEVDAKTGEYIMEVVSISQFRAYEWLHQSAAGQPMSRLRCVTPPHLPMSPISSPQFVSMPSEGSELMLTPENLLAIEATHMNQQILEHDRLRLNDLENDEQVDIIDKSVHADFTYRETASISPSPIGTKRVRQYKAESPAMPEFACESPRKKPKTDELPTEIHDLVSPITSDDSANDQQTMIKNVIDTCIPKATLSPSLGGRHWPMETLCEFAMFRVTVPVIDIDKPLAPWNNSIYLSSQHPTRWLSNSALLSGFVRGLDKDEVQWRGLSTLEKILLWSPFSSSLGNFDAHENLDDSALSNCLNEMSTHGFQNIDSLVWRTDQLLVLREDSDLDVIEHSLDHFEEPRLGEISITDRKILPSNLIVTQNPAYNTGAQSPMRNGKSDLICLRELLQQRKIELKSRHKSKVDSTKSPRWVTGSSKKGGSGNESDTESSFGDLDEQAGLSEFLQIHSGSLPASRPSKGGDDRNCSLLAKPPLSPNADSIPEYPASLQRELLTPRVVPLVGPTSIAISSSLLSNRSFVRQLQAELPLLELIDRGPLSRDNSRDTSLIMPNAIVEADITVSPSTGIFLTSLQKVQQKPLPGQSSYFGVRERLFLVAERYEHLILLVWNPQPHLLNVVNSKDPVDNLQEQESDAMTALSAFTTSLVAEVEINYVEGDERVLATWAASFISKYCFTDVQLVQDESEWENYLRSSGMNPFAAQAVLCLLGSPEHDEHSEYRRVNEHHDHEKFRYGLSIFMRMSPYQRTEMFGQMMGGHRVLQNISEEIERELVEIPRHISK